MTEESELRDEQRQEDIGKAGKQRKQEGMGRKRGEGKGRELGWKVGKGKGHGQFENPMLPCKL